MGSEMCIRDSFVFVYFSDAGTWANSKDRNLASSKLTLWVPSEQKFIHVGQELTISQMLQILYDRGNELEVPVIKFLIIEQNDDSIAEDELPRGKNIFLRSIFNHQIPS